MSFVFCVLKFRKLIWGKENKKVRYIMKGSELPFSNMHWSANLIRLLFILLLTSFRGEGWKEAHHLVNMSLITVDPLSWDVFPKRSLVGEVKDKEKLFMVRFNWVHHLPVGVTIFTSGRKYLSLFICTEYCAKYYGYTHSTNVPYLKEFGLKQRQVCGHVLIMVYP